MKQDRHQATYIPFRCAKEMSAEIDRLAEKQHKPKSEIVRNLVDQGLIATGVKSDDDYLTRVVKEAVEKIMKPQVNRLAAISAKATQVSGAAFFMGMYAAMCNCTPDEQEELTELTASARSLGIQYLKLKDGDVDDFFRTGVQSILRKKEDYNG